MFALFKVTIGERLSSFRQKTVKTVGTSLDGQEFWVVLRKIGTRTEFLPLGLEELKFGKDEMKEFANEPNVIGLIAILNVHCLFKHEMIERADGSLFKQVKTP